MAVSLEDVIALENLDAKLRILLPALYGGSYEDVLPVSMGSAALKYGGDGRVAWNEIWASFCDLAMAGGPPHRGTLLQPASRDEIAADPAAHERCLEEIRRGISLAAGLVPLEPLESGPAAWVAVRCHGPGMASWLKLAIVAENVLAESRGDILLLPAGPRFRLEKEIKNVITSAAKTCHYWLQHMSQEQRESIAAMLGARDDSAPSHPGGGAGGRAVQAARVVESIRERTGLDCILDRPGWLGVKCSSIRSAVWIMRALIADSVLSRREGEVVLVSLDAAGTDERGEGLARAVSAAHRLAVVKKLEP